MNAINKTFLTAGNAIFTVIPTMEAIADGFSSHYTYLIEKVEFPAKNGHAASTRYFVKVLTGQDNTNDYTYLGMLNVTNGAISLTQKSAFPATAKRVQIVQRLIGRIWRGEFDVIEKSGWKVRHAGKCAKCGKTLTVPESIEAGFGPECVKMVTGCKLAEYIAG